MKLWEPSPCCGNHFLSLGRNQVFLAMFHTYCLLSTWVSICQWLHGSGPKWDANSDSLLKTVPEDKLVKIWYPTIYICRCINSSTLRNSTFSGCEESTGPWRKMRLCLKQCSNFKMPILPGIRAIMRRFLCWERRFLREFWKIRQNFPMSSCETSVHCTAQWASTWT